MEEAAVQAVYIGFRPKNLEKSIHDIQEYREGEAVSRAKRHSS